MSVETKHDRKVVFAFQQVIKKYVENISDH